MARKVISGGTGDAGDSTHYGTDDLGKINNLLNGVDQSSTDPVTMNTSWLFNNQKLQLRNPANTFTSTVINPTITANSNFQFNTPYDYYIFIDPDDSNKIKARNGRTGVIDYVHATNADVVINAAITNLSAGSTQTTSAGPNLNLWTGGKYGVIFIGPGLYILANSIIAYSNIALIASGAWNTILMLINSHADNNNATLIKSSTWDTRSTTAGTSTTRQQGDTGIIIRDLTVFGNKSNNATVTTVNPNPSGVAGVASWGHGIALYGSGHILENIAVKQCPGAGIILQGTATNFGDTTTGNPLDYGTNYIRNFDVGYNGQHGILLRRTSFVERGWTYKNGEPGIDIQTSGYFGGSNSFLRDLWCFYDSTNHGSLLGSTYDGLGPEIRFTGWNSLYDSFIEGPLCQSDSIYLGYSGAPLSSTDFTLAETFPVLDAANIYMDGSRASAILLGPHASTCRIQAHITGNLQTPLATTYYNVAQGVTVLGSNNYLDITVKQFNNSGGSTNGAALTLGTNSDANYGTNVASTNQIKLTSWDNTMAIKWGNASNAQNNIFGQLYMQVAGDSTTQETSLTGSPNFAANTIELQTQGSSTATYRSHNGGSVTLTGVTSQTAYTIPHLLFTTPNIVNVRPANTAAVTAGTYYLTANSTNITVNFTTAPGNGTSNLFWWDARVSP